nr:MAG TPA: hypothetical protein [Caudoviricetes sp.]
MQNCNHLTITPKKTSILPVFFCENYFVIFITFLSRTL